MISPKLYHIIDCVKMLKTHNAINFRDNPLIATPWCTGAQTRINSNQTSILLIAWFSNPASMMFRP